MDTRIPRDRLRVGVVGVSPTRGWATTAHLPALAALPEFDTVAVASTRLEGAETVAGTFEIPHAFGDPLDLIANADVDVVAICVRAPLHYEFVKAAVEAGKHIYCEWPLAVDAEQARELAELAETEGVSNIIGMQAYQAPDARFVRDLLDEGIIGRVKAVSLVTLTPTMATTRLTESMAYTADRRTGTNLLTTSCGHALAALSRVVGDVEEVSAYVENAQRHVTVIESGEILTSDVPGEISVSGRLRSGAVLALACHGATPAAAPRFTLRIIGSKGALVAEPAQLGYAINVSEWIVTLYRGDDPAATLTVPADEGMPATIPAGPARNIAALYRELALAVANGRPANPDFRAALGFHEVVEAISRAAERGGRQLLPASRLPS
jgi:predicted dehydrogenase